MTKRVYDRAFAALRICGDTLDPLSVTLALRLPPDHVHRNGEPRLVRTRNGKITEHSHYRGGMWSMSSEAWVQSPRLAVHLEWLLNQVEAKSDALAALLADGVKSEFFCFSSGSTPIPPSVPRSVRARAVALGIQIEIDHYRTDTP